LGGPQAASILSPLFLFYPAPVGVAVQHTCAWQRSTCYSPSITMCTSCICLWHCMLHTVVPCSCCASYVHTRACSQPFSFDASVAQRARAFARFVQSTRAFAVVRRCPHMTLVLSATGVSSLPLSLCFAFLLRPHGVASVRECCPIHACRICAATHYLSSVLFHILSDPARGALQVGPENVPTVGFPE